MDTINRYTTGMADRVFRSLALRNVKRIKARMAEQEAEYERMVEDCYRQGYRPHYCRHGRDLWVDYDVICGYCEEGDPDPYVMALNEARAAVRASDARYEALRAFRDACNDGGIRQDDRQKETDMLVDWALAPLADDWRPRGF